MVEIEEGEMVEMQERGRMAEGRRPRGQGQLRQRGQSGS